MNKITEDLSGWENGSYYVGNTEGATIQYNTIFYASDNPKAENLHIYGLTGSPEIRDDEVTLTANNFSGNSISVTNNDDDYEFILSGDFGGKTFTGSVGNDDITNLAGANN
ncbi:MAG: hypothetical protein IJG32_01310, partial [Selenomonadaceae bacterium]|nr:hypothetical protein [Selenomonadaceae bacterium]